MAGIIEWLGTAVSRVLALLYPRRCTVCQTAYDRDTDSGASAQGMCDNCAAEWMQARNVLCPVCQKQILLCRCRTLGDGVPLYSLLPYRPGGDSDAVSRFLRMRKTYQNPRAEEFLAGQVSALCECAVAECGGVRTDWVLTYPPRSRRKRREVGYDQSEVLARRLSRLTGIPMLPCMVRVRGADAAQKMLDAAERAANAQSSYVLSARYAGDIRGKRVMLIDDIATTGATLSVCASILKEAGADTVIALTAARTEHGR